jgi:hypothetical protein
MVCRPARLVAQTERDVLRASDALRDEAALELASVLEGTTCKRLVRADVPTCGAYAISRALNGGDSNPLYRVAMVFVLMKRMGMGRERAQRILNWLQELVDAIWPPEELPVLEDALAKDQDLDTGDDSLRFKAVLGCPEARARLIEIKRGQIAHAGVVILALRRATAP